ncbi:hypothetical protein [Nocardia sp. NPDC005998]|uniref:hypothetical protein n=1 Tax=Nocardia sp. NPDC005998 TaxID=3156894 RepID=UPI0033A16BD0
MTYEDYQRRIIEAQEQWNRDRDWIYKTESGYKNFEGETQPPHVTTPDSYDHLTLQEMQTAVSAMKPKLVDDAVTMWANIGLELQGSFETFNREFARTIDGQNGRPGWTGTAAQAATTAVNNYYEKSVPLATAATLTSLKLSEMKTGLEQTQALMPGLTERPEITGKTLPKDGVMKSGEYTQTEAEQEGRRILRTVYGQVAGQTDVGLPYMPTAPTITDGPGGPVTPGPNPGGSPGDSGGGGGSGNGNGNGNGGPTGGDSGSGTGGQTGTQPTAATSDTTTPTSTNPQSTTPTTQSSSPTTATPTTSGTSGPSTGTPHSATPGIGSPSSGRVGTGSPGSTSGGPGRSVAGTPTTGSTAAASAARQSTTASGRAGTSGMSGMGGAGQGKGSDEDRKKGVPDYLITAEHGQEATGLDSLPKTVPPVIGGDPDGAQQY